MNREDLETLLADKPTEVKARAAVLFNAVVVTMSAYNADPERPKAKRINMEDAREAFNRYIAEIGGGVSGSGETFDTLAAVLEYLKNNGWKAARQSLYRHHSQGKIIPDADGKYKLRAVEKYAKTFLKQSATGKRMQENTDDLQRQKLELELKNLKLKNERDQFNYEKDRGLFIPKDQVEIELATRAGVLVAGLKHWVQSKAADWIAAVSGDNKRVGELINTMNRDVDEHINHYASSKEYEVIIEAESESEVAPITEEA